MCLFSVISSSHVIQIVNLSQCTNVDWNTELEVLSRIDHRTYFEIPAILLASLVYTFWLCFAQIGAPPTQLPVPIRSTIWPLLWIVFAVGLIVNPLPIMRRSSRFWFVRNLGKQFLSGMRPVEFTDFWMG